MKTFNTTTDTQLTTLQAFHNTIRTLVRLSTKHRFCSISIDDGFLEVKVTEAVKNTTVDGISTIAKSTTLIAIDTTTIVPVVYEGSAELLGTTKYKLAEMVDDLYA